MVIVCDSHYRSAITAIRAFQKEGEEVIAVTTEINKNPPAFSSKFIKDKFVLPADKNLYTKELIALCKKYNNPIIFPVGNFTLNVLSENLDTFKLCSRFCVSSPQMLSDLNDKKWVKKEAECFGIQTPKSYSLNSIDKFPLVVKPFCGEKFKLKANQRYKIVYNKEQLETAYSHFSKFDDNPIIEEYIEGQGVGVSFILNKDSKAQTVFCHKRLLEYPITGGPSVYLQTFYDKKLIDDTKHFLENIGFVGIAMVEYKYSGNDYYLLEINPRIWGSFPSTEKANSDFISAYLRACNSDTSLFTCKYEHNKRIKFMRGLIMAFFSNLKCGNFKKSLKILGVILSPTIHDATFSIRDVTASILDFFRR